MEAARHYAAAMTLLRGLDDTPVDPATLAGADVPTLIALDEARHPMRPHSVVSGVDEGCR